MKTKFCLLFILLFTTFAKAQSDDIVLNAIRSLHKIPDADWKISDQYTDKLTGLTYVYVQQKYHGVPVLRAISNIVIKDNKVASAKSGFADDIKTRVHGDKPSLTVKDAINATFSHLDLNSDERITLLESNESDHVYIFSGGNTSRNKIKVELLYVPINGEYYLAWNVSIDLKKEAHWWNVRIDATTGEYLEKTDYVVHCSFDPQENQSETMMFDGLNPSSPMTPSSVPSYRVFPFPVESPTLGSRALLPDPSDPASSPFGWHDENGAAGAEFTITRGNNTYTYEDEDNDDLPGYSPDGGAGLTFDYPYNFNQQPANNKDAALTNLFYANNTIHDKLYRYGFTEAAGNFQVNNYGNGGIANDAVQSEGFDGSGSDNANFTTPPDGIKPRMQMYLWGGFPCSSFHVNSPASVAGNYAIGNFVEFNPVSANATGNLILVDDGSANPTLGCLPITNNLTGKIAVIDRGNCLFVEKVINAQNKGAIGVIIVNNGPGVFGMAGIDPSITIPTLMISQDDGNTLKTEMLSNTVNATINICPNIKSDSDFDNGVIAHEYGHGLSTRLTGGPSISECLYNGEQGGEGWSDWLGLMLTIHPGDNGTEARNIASYLVGQNDPSIGIRVYPYSTDMNIDPHTYGDIPIFPEAHYIGEIWCSAIWDMSWLLINQYGYNTNPTVATAGNNIAMRLVIEGMKLQPCGPGFLDSRDAILLADHLLYNDAHRCQIWQAFSQRGMGYFASQGDALIAGDETPDFTMPPFVQPSITGDGLFCKPNSTVLDAGAGWNSYTWNTGASSRTIVPQTFGTYTVSVSGIGCSNTLETGTASVTVSPSFTPTATASPANICPGGSSQLSAVGEAQISGNKAYKSSRFAPPAPYGNFWTSEHEQYLVYGSELASAGLTAGNLTGLSFDVVNHNTGPGSRNLTISVAATNATNMSNSFVSTGFTQVYSSPNFVTAPGWNFHPFSTPFAWNGVSNIVVDISMINCNSCPGSPCIEYYLNDEINLSKTAFKSTSFTYNDFDCSVPSFTPASPVYATDMRPNMKFRGPTIPVNLYTWSPSTFLNSSIISNPLATNVTSSTSYNVTATRSDGCYGTATATVSLISAPLAPAFISGPVEICKGQTGIQYCADPVEGAISYIWTLPSGITGSSSTNCITVNFSNNYNGGTICVRAVNSCFQGANTCLTPVILTKKPAKPGPIVGQSPVCPDNYYAYYITPVPTASNYIWTITGNGGVAPLNIVFGQGSSGIAIYVPVGYNGNQKLRVRPENCKGLGDERTFDVKVTGIPNTPGNINGPNSVCKSKSKNYNVGNVQNATYYFWDVTGGALITAGQGTKNITIDFHTATSPAAIISVTASNACGASNPRTKNVMVNLNCKEDEDIDVTSPAATLIAYPNPTSGKINLAFDAEHSSKCILRVIDMTGRILLTSEEPAIEGVNLRELDLNNVAKGMYFISVERNDAARMTVRIVVE